MARRSRTKRPFSIKYVPVATDGGPDQVLTVENHTDVSVLPTLAFTPRDIWGRELPNVAAPEPVGAAAHGDRLGRVVLVVRVTVSHGIRSGQF